MANTATMASQVKTPPAEKLYGSAVWKRIAPTALLRPQPAGKANMAPMNQLSMPMITPSTMTMRWIAPLDAPMARMTPISRVRSNTLVLMVPISPSAPTDAISTPMAMSR